MADAKIVDTKPLVLHLEPGDYYWCSCGQSTHQPYCDGSHQGTGFTPVQFRVTEPQTLALCQCRRTANPPFCDGSHTTLKKI